LDEDENFFFLKGIWGIGPFYVKKEETQCCKDGWGPSTSITNLLNEAVKHLRAWR